MAGSLNTKSYLKKYKARSKWHRVLTCMAAVVVFCTTYALVLPALTLERPVSCGMEEHIHNEDCYIQMTAETTCTLETLGVHEHTDDCYDLDGNVICGYADFVVHQHDASCYDENQNLWCTLPEIEEDTNSESYDDKLDGETEALPSVQGDALRQGELICTESTEPHTHTEACYTKTETLVCEIAESDGHQHKENCLDETGEAVCGYEESAGHQHGPECYEEVSELTCTLSEEAHQHTDVCYAQEDSLPAMILADLLEPSAEATPAESDLIYGEEKVILHEHTEECFDESGSLICGKLQVLEHVHSEACMQPAEGFADPETLTCTISEGEGAHSHSAEAGCYDEDGQLICQLEESEGHQHSARCYGTWVLTCDLPEHIHGEACYETELEAPQYICGKAEHQHGDECRDAAGQLICEKEEHSHSDSCLAPVAEQEELEAPQYICGLDEHQHGEDCYDAEGNLICKKEEHSHSESCLAPAEEQEQPEQPAEPQYICGLEEHQHGEDCYDEAGQEICGKTAHSHDESCLAPAKEQEPALTFSGDDYTVSIHYDSEAGIPENARLQVEEITADTEEYASCYQQIVDTVSSQAVAYAMLDVDTEADTAADAEAAPEIVPQMAQERFFNISLMADDQLVALQAPVEVELQLNNAAMSAEDCTVVECTEEIVQVAEMADVQSVQNEDDTLTATFQAQQLNTYGVMALSASKSAPTTTETLESVVGPEAYTLEYLLSKYNVISFGNVNLSNHTVGSILVKGDLTGSGSTFGGYVDAPAEFKTAPSYIQGYVSYIAEDMYAGEKENLYVGTSNEVTPLYPTQVGVQSLNKKTGVCNDAIIYVTDNFVDWNQVENLAQVTSNEMAQRSSRTIKLEKTWQDIQIEKGTTVTLDVNGYYTGKISIIDSEYTTPTVINVINTKDGNFLDIPQFLAGQFEINGTTQFNANGTSIVWNFPDAKNISFTTDSGSVIGHILAPNATVTMKTSYNGCIVCKEAIIENEGHIWPYNGGKLIPVQTQLKAGKTVNGQTPGAGEIFDFHLQEICTEQIEGQESKSSWKTIDTKSNDGSQILFDPINYTKEGTYWYRILEDQTPLAGYTKSTKQYLVAVQVTKKEEDKTTTYSIAKTDFYQVNQDEFGANLEPLDPTTGEIDKSKLTFIAPSNAKFDNAKSDGGKAVINVVKKWYDADGKNITGNITKESITFTLKRMMSKTVSTGGGDSTPVNVKIRAIDKWRVDQNNQLEYRDVSSRSVPKNSIVTVTFNVDGDEQYSSGFKYILINNGDAIDVNGVKIDASTLAFQYKGDNRREYKYNLEGVSEDTVIYVVIDNDTTNSVKGEISDPSSETQQIETEIDKSFEEIYTVLQEEKWHWKSRELETTGTTSDGSTVYYTYFIEESPVDNYETSYENNGGITSGIITIKNTKQKTPDYTLPEAGGGGVQWYTLTGLLLMGTALGLYRRQKTSRKREL